jgi:hypothetical protein
VLPRQKMFAVVALVLLILFILALIRRRKLKEEYALLWLATGIAVLILVLWYPLLEGISRLIGAVAPTTTLFLFAFLFLMLISIHFSIKFSRLSDQIKDLTQELAFLRHELEALRSKDQKIKDSNPDTGPG